MEVSTARVLRLETASLAMPSHTSTVATAPRAARRPVAVLVVVELVVGAVMVGAVVVGAVVIVTEAAAGDLAEATAGVVAEAAAGVVIETFEDDGGASENDQQIFKTRLASTCAYSQYRGSDVCLVASLGSQHNYYAVLSQTV